jgi:hypothetical protein
VKIASMIVASLARPRAIRSSPAVPPMGTSVAVELNATAAAVCQAKVNAAVEVKAAVPIARVGSLARPRAITSSGGLPPVATRLATDVKAALFVTATATVPRCPVLVNAADCCVAATTGPSVAVEVKAAD